MKFGFIAHNELSQLEADCAFAARHGFQGLEFNWWDGFRDLTEDQVRAMRRMLDQHGLECSTFGLWGWNHIAADPAERAESQRQLERAIMFAQIMNTPTLITGGGQLGDDLGENVAAFAEQMRPFVDRAREAGMQMAIYGFHGGFLRTAAAFDALWKVVPDVGLKFDPGNIDHAGEDYIDVLKRYGKRVVHVHIKEHLNHDGDVVSQPAAGMGDIQWGKVMAFLYENGYNGYLTIEPHGPIWSRPPLRNTMILLSQRYISQFLLDTP